MFLEHNSNIVLEILDIIMLCKHNVPEAYFILMHMPYVDLELIHMHARRLRLIGAALCDKIEWLIRFMEGKGPG